ncbi:unnamed protein product [Brachionus calyciflorus]|uniref:Uncharacterized protein n=1 Tax=Brachionus calyciflorus TaxID=104777 RepID=A0A814EGT7_9BILA|nr:unnamed protein product [Brachionus calyciflorus]
MANFKQDLKNFNKFEHSSNKYTLDRQPSKRFSFVDKGKLWAKQLIKTHGFSNFPFFSAHKSFDSCDSGIDENSFSTNISKISTSSTCSFFTNIQSDSASTTYLSNSNSLISPIDENGYLVPIINYSLNKQTVKNAARKASNSHLIRSFSTRSAYTSSHHNMMNNDRILNNRATICDQIRINREEQDCCLKCNSKLSITKKRMSIFFSNKEMVRNKNF